MWYITVQVAGALAERGCSLDKVFTAAQSVADNIGEGVGACDWCAVMLCVCVCAGTMSVSLSPCSVPGQKPTFSLGEDEMEWGLGEVTHVHAHAVY